ncbi:hypothetical protein ES703_55922 [subsurface metagenome]
MKETGLILKTEERETLYREAVKQWGVDAQVIMAFEEMAELTQSLCKLRRNNYRWGDDKQLRTNLKEELADVEIMLEQVKYIFEVHDIEDIINMKLKRLQGLMGIKLQ